MLLPKAPHKKIELQVQYRKIIKAKRWRKVLIQWRSIRVKVQNVWSFENPRIRFSIFFYMRTPFSWISRVHGSLLVVDALARAWSFVKWHLFHPGSIFETFWNTIASSAYENVLLFFEVTYYVGVRENRRPHVAILHISVGETKLQHDMTIWKHKKMLQESICLSCALYSAGHSSGNLVDGSLLVIHTRAR